MAAGVCLSVVLLANNGASQAQRSPDADELVSKWQDAVASHAAGRADESVRWVESLSIDQWRLLNIGLKRYFSGLADQKVVSNTLIEQAAVLHMDAAMFGSVVSAPLVGAGWPGAATPLVKTLDGESLGSTDANWQWIIARRLIDLMYPSPLNEPFVPAWYHAAAAYLFERGNSGELGSHLEHGAALLPNDARILFDRACLSELLSRPRSQLVMDDLRSQANAKRPAGALFIPGQPPTAGRSGLMTEGEAIADADRLFRRTLAADAGFIEARVRLARLLEIRGKYTEAAMELTTALGNPAIAQDSALSYYAHLFAARADQSLGRREAAAAHLRDALTLFPNAQSAVVAQSQLALMNADAEGALAQMRRLHELPSEPHPSSDPWWIYDAGPGRRTDVLLAEMRAQIGARKQ